MKDEYDFTNAERGKFHRPDAQMRLPIYLDTEVEKYLAQLAARKGEPIDKIVNGLLRREIELIESAK
jgi:hypothetical protein